jgi:hypothetical protein
MAAVGGDGMIRGAGRTVLLLKGSGEFGILAT